MQVEGAGKRIRVYIGHSDQWRGQALYNAIVQRARQEGLAGATVMQGIEGFGANSRIHRASLLDLSFDLPIVVEIVDQSERIEGFLPLLAEMVMEGLITVESCHIFKSLHHAKG